LFASEYLPFGQSHFGGLTLPSAHIIHLVADEQVLQTLSQTLQAASLHLLCGPTVADPNPFWFDPDG
jgi:hypothetical protein